MVILDIGANIGFYTRILSSLTGPTGKVHAFEPDPVNYAHLRDATRNLSNVTTHQLAVGEMTGKIKLFRSRMLNVDHQTYDNGEFRDHTETDVVALDNFMPVDIAVDFIKIDP